MRLWFMRLMMKVPHDGFRMWYYNWIYTPSWLIPFSIGLWCRRKVYAEMGIDWWNDGVRPHIVFMLKGPQNA